MVAECSVEEAKKRMYACSTTTYIGFQAVMTEEMSEKFRGLPGVVFILPDSYLYPETKEYGGDKYDNGVITPRPPPVQYGRQTRPRNQNRFDRPNYNNRPPPNNYGENYNVQQNYGQPGQDGRVFGPPGERGDFGQGERRGPMPNYQGTSNQGAQNNFPPQEQRNFSQGQGRDFRPGGSYGQGDYRQGPPHGYNADYRQGPAPGPNFNNQGGGMSSNYGRGNVQDGGPGYGGDNRQGGGFTYGGQNDAGPVDGQPGSWQGGDKLLIAVGVDVLRAREEPAIRRHYLAFVLVYIRVSNNASRT
uniref:MORF/ORRM1/DAG-like MORF domain-containing protein n=1 Tax=Ananas comosus var. bracteatus TaxID=296719 RepID=A0A6V7Q1V7_ANACO|nr:unnamed protein product [Ananas comosus var. bracteatus]